MLLHVESLFGLRFVFLLQTRRVHVRRVNAADANVAALQLHAETVRETLHRILTGRIRAVSDVAQHAACASDKVNLSLCMKRMNHSYMIPLDHSRNDSEERIHRSHVVDANGIVIVLNCLTEGISTHHTGNRLHTLFSPFQRCR